MFEALARIEAAVREHAPDVIDELRRAVDALDEIARACREIALTLSTDEQGVIDGTGELISDEPA